MDSKYSQVNFLCLSDNASMALCFISYMEFKKRFPSQPNVGLSFCFLLANAELASWLDSYNAHLEKPYPNSELSLSWKVTKSCAGTIIGFPYNQRTEGKPFTHLHSHMLQPDFNSVNSNNVHQNVLKERHCLGLTVRLGLLFQRE